MSSSSAKIVLLASSFAMLATGCTTPDAGQTSRLGIRSGLRPDPAVPTMASAATSARPGNDPVASLTDYTNWTQPPQLLPAEPSVAQVGCFSPAAGCCGNCSAGGICGCPSCSDCATKPSGYVLLSAEGWNAYGIDPQEFICDGGDHDPAAVLRRDDTLAGLQPEDTVVHYTTEARDVEIQASNRVCLYAPRFLSVRKITGAVAGGRAIGAAQFDRPQGPTRIDLELPGLVMTDTVELAHADVARRIDAMRERIRGVPIESILQPEQAADVMAALVGMTIAELEQLRDDEKALFEQLAQAAVVWTLDECLEVVIEDLKPPTLTRDEHLEGFTIYDFPDAGRLQICKLADRSDALPGEIVTFAIRVENVGDSTVDHVVLTDNLTTRLEYVDGSQTCSGGAQFTSLANDGESLRLEWKLTDKLRVGESVTIRFQCKVR